MRIGVLALQGAFIEHRTALQRLGIEAPEVRLPAQLEGLDGLVIPGGESTTIGKLAVTYGLLDPIREKGRHGWPIWGTCAGMVLLARDLGGPAQPLLGLMDVTVERNAFGRQVQSFEANLRVEEFGEKPFHAVFIRAPLIQSVGPDVQVLARLDNGTIVAARQRNLLATAFHPELTADNRFHAYFARMVEESRDRRKE